jgi:cytochrome c oxidase assembly factor CtaG
MSNNKILWITRTGILTALLIAAQAITTATTANQFVTGSVVNLVLAITVLYVGYSSGITVSVIAPITAILVGHLAGNAVLAPTIPFIAIGNIVFVVLLRIFAISINKNEFKFPQAIAGVIVSSLAKFGALYLLIVQIAIPLILHLPSPKKEMVGAMFTFPQLITALIGGALALAIYPAIKKIVKK